MWAAHLEEEENMSAPLTINSLAALVARREAQKRRVCHLYRRALKETLDYCIHRDAFYEEADKLRGRFDVNKAVSDIDTIERLLVQGEAEYQRLRHPDPYIVPWAYGGTKYARNPPVPPEIKVVMDYGRENWSTH